jgi:predicted DNA-binding transcriptional regulator YafY
MPSKVIYERFLWFHTRVKDKKYPNTKTLAERFEITRKTAQRDVEFMKDRLKAPLYYVAENRGYVYENDAYELPALWLREEEITSLLISYRLVSAIPDSALKSSLKAFLDQIFSKLSPPKSVSIRELSDKVSVKNIAYSRTSERVFQIILGSLLNSKPATIEYLSPHTGELTRRDILPLHLLQYMGTWHIIAHCSLKNGLRDFVLSRIKSIIPSPQSITTVPPVESIKEYIRTNFGIMSSAESIEVCLCFSPEITPWVSEQVWHPAQKMQQGADGALRLTFPVADFREIKREILKYGAQVEVIAPETLREEVKKEIEKMKIIY